MRTNTIRIQNLLLLIAGCFVISSCSPEISGTNPSAPEHGAPTADYEKGPHGGRLLRSGDFALELAIFETGVPPEFRAWVSSAGKPVDAQKVDLGIRLTRLGNVVDQIGFKAEDDYLRGDQVVYEPHSFVVSIDAIADGKKHHWEYDNFEGRTQIVSAVAEAFELETGIAGPAVIHETIEVYGLIEPNADRIGVVRARFDGLIKAVSTSLGESVKAGQPLLSVESDESLKSYVVTAPISGIITERNASAGEPTAGRSLFTIVDPSTVWVNLAVFPSDLARVQPGTPVTVFPPGGSEPVSSTIDRINIVAEINQAVMARVVLDNTAGRFFPGSYVQAQIQVAEYSVPLAVKRDGLQSFRDFTVVYAQVGDEYEVRMLELGRQDGEWIEVLSGLEPGTRYVTSNSYLVKADIEKSGASHDH
ncbi:MAG: efflux RND transporter periplasmic adaptor subunit [Xanthomonadales bacterium]|nr:efflux RND transporter periplasmic adaptor subunit [Xanthomonadales bacterium]